MITGVAHTGIVVRDMDAMVAFYRDVFGFREVLNTRVEGTEADEIVGFHVDAERIVVMELNGAQIELLEYRPSGRDYPGDYRSNDLFGVHLALATDDLDGDHARLREAGVEIISSAPQTIPESHPIFAGTRVLYARDPEGHPLELIQFPG